MSAVPASPELRPLRVREIVGTGLRIYLRNWPTLWEIVVCVVLPAQILVNFVVLAMLPSHWAYSGGVLYLSSDHDINRASAAEWTGRVIGYIAVLLAQAACIRAVAGARLGEPVTSWASLRFAGRRVLALVVLGIVTTLVTLVGLAFCIVPGVYLYGALFVAMPALLLEGSGPFRSLSRSPELVRGRWLATFGVAVAALAVLAAGYVISWLLAGVLYADSAPNTFAGFVLRVLVWTVGSVLTLPAVAALTTVLYQDLRLREGSPATPVSG